jgi:hypothetical protein
MVRFSGVGSKAELSPSSIKDIEAALKIVDPNFTPLEQHVTSAATTTTTATVTSKPSPAGESRSFIVIHLTHILSQR